MTKKFSSFKEQQLLVENWRKFAHPRPTQLEEEIIKILNQVNEGDLNEGALEVMGKVAKKLKFDRLVLIAAMTGALAPSTANAGILDDINNNINAFGVEVQNQIKKTAGEAEYELEQRGIVFDQDGKAVKSTETKAEKEWNDRTFKTIDDAAKEAVKQADPTGKSIEGGLENPQWQEHEHFFKTKELAKQYADHQKRTFNAPNTFPVKVGSRAGGKKHGWIVIELQPSESALQQIYGGGS